MPTYPRLMAIPALSLALLTSTAYPADSRDSCADEAAIEASFYKVGDLLAKLTRAQVEQGANVRALVAERARSENWTDARQAEVVAAFLASPEYGELEAERAPHRALLDSYKRQLRSVKSMAEARSACFAEGEAIAAAEASFAINIKQTDLARLFIASAK